MIRIIVILACIGLSAVNGLACDCDRIGIDSALRHSSIAFRGTLVERRIVYALDDSAQLILIPDDKEHRDSPFRSAYYQCKFKVTRGYKGCFARTIYVYTNLLSGACGFDFSKEKDFVVFATSEAALANKNQKTIVFYQTNQCSGTRAFTKDVEDTVLNASK